MLQDISLQCQAAKSITCVCLYIQQLQQLQWVASTIFFQPVGQQLGASISHSSIPVLQQLLNDLCALLDAAGSNGGGVKQLSTR